MSAPRPIMTTDESASNSCGDPIPSIISVPSVNSVYSVVRIESPAARRNRSDRIAI